MLTSVRDSKTAPYEAVYAFCCTGCFRSILPKATFCPRVNPVSLFFALDRFQAASSESEINIYEIGPAGDASSLRAPVFGD